MKRRDDGGRRWRKNRGKGEKYRLGRESREREKEKGWTGDE